MNRLGARSVAAMLTLAVLVGPDAIQSPAPSASAQTLSAETLVLTASELGPGWSLSKDPERGNAGGLDSYSAVYPNLPALRVVAVRVIAAITTDVADQTLTDLQNAYTTDGVAFSSHIGLGNGPAFKGTRTGDQVLWVFYVFRVNSSSALVQFLGPTDQEADIQVQALRYATAQQDKMQVAAASELAALPSVAVLAPSSTYSTTNGLKTETQLRDELAVAGYSGPWDTSSVLTAYQRATAPPPPVPTGVIVVQQSTAATGINVETNLNPRKNYVLRVTSEPNGLALSLTDATRTDLRITTSYEETIQFSESDKTNGYVSFPNYVFINKINIDRKESFTGQFLTSESQPAGPRQCLRQHSPARLRWLRIPHW